MPNSDMCHGARPMRTVAAMRGWRLYVMGVAIAGLLVSSAAAFALPVASPSLVMSGDLARDCVAQAMLDGKRVDAIRFIAWCSVQTGEARFSLRRAGEGRSQPGAPILSFSAQSETTGPGADRRFRCRRQGESLHCSGRKSRAGSCSRHDHRSGRDSLRRANPSEDRRGRLSACPNGVSRNPSSTRELLNFRHAQFPG